MTCYQLHFGIFNGNRSEGFKETTCSPFKKRMEVAWGRSNRNVLPRLPPGHMAAGKHSLTYSLIDVHFSGNYFHLPADASFDFKGVSHPFEGGCSENISHFNTF